MQNIQAFAQDEQAQKFLRDDVVQDKFSKAKRLAEVNVKDYDAVFYVGGHGPVLDLATDSTNAKLVASVRICTIVSALGNAHEISSSGMRERSWPRYATDQRKRNLVQIGLHNHVNLHYSALVSAVDGSGKSIFAGKKATSFTNSEEIAVDKVKVSKRTTHR